MAGGPQGCVAAENEGVEIRSTALMTVVGGKIVYQREDLSPSMPIGDELSDRSHNRDPFLVQSHVAPDRFNQLCGIKPDTIFEYQLYLFHVGDPPHGIPIDDHQIGLLALGDRADCRS